MTTEQQNKALDQNTIGRSSFLIFGGEKFYPSGGWQDYLDGCLSESDAIEVANSWLGERKQVDTRIRIIQWVHVADTENNKIIYHAVQEKNTEQSGTDNPSGKSSIIY